MGLPSGVLWSPVNVDDSQPSGLASSPFQYGASFFSWGNIDAHDPSSNDAFSYDWGSINAESPYYEGQPYGTTPGCLIQDDLSLEQDAARHICGGLWRMPTAEEFQELLNNCKFIDVEGVEIPPQVADKMINYPLPNGSGFVVGIRLRSNINGAILFFAACGQGSNTNWSYRGARGFYWSKSFQSPYNCKAMSILGSGVSGDTTLGRHYGLAVRPVITPVD